MTKSMWLTLPNLWAQNFDRENQMRGVDNCRSEKSKF